MTEADLQAGPERRATVSILLCNYNDARFLPDSLNAIVGQSRPADEIVIVDDGSTDDSRDVIARYAARHQNIRVLQNETNSGLLFSIARAMEAARMDFIVWAAADDKLLPDFLARNMALLERHPEAVMSFSRLATFNDSDGEVVEYTPDRFRDAFDLGPEARFLDQSAFLARLRRSYLWMSGNTVVMRRDLVQAFGGFHPGLRWHADWFTFYMIGLRNGSCVIPETLAMMRSRPGTFSGDGMQRRREQREVMNRLVDLLLTASNHDLYWIIARHPTILSPFGTDILFAALRNPLAWPIAIPFGMWYALHWLNQRPLYLALRRRLGWS